MTFTTSIKSGLLKALERHPIERIHNLQYDFKYSKQRAQNTGKRAFRTSKKVSPTSISMKPLGCPIVILLF